MAIPSQVKLPALYINGVSTDIDIETDDAVNEVLRSIANACPSQLLSPGNEFTGADSVEQIKDVNRRLITHIDVVRYKINLDAREQQSEINRLKRRSQETMAKMDNEIENLRLDHQVRKDQLNELTEKNQEKNKEVIHLERYVTDLNKEVKTSKDYAADMKRKLDELEKRPVHNEQTYTAQNNQILELRTEIKNLKENLTTLEEELSLANHKIAHQGIKLRQMEIDKGNFEIKFKDDLVKVNRVMLNEIEKLRDLFTQQCEELIKIRVNTEETKKNTKDIRDAVCYKTSTILPQNAIQEVKKHNGAIPLFPHLKKNYK